MSTTRVGMHVFRFCAGGGLALLIACGAAPPPRPAADGRGDQAAEMFRERCQRAGEFIRRTVEEVDGIVLLTLRPKDINFSDQYRLDDPYGFDVTGDGYIESLLRGSRFSPSLPPRPEQAYSGYLYVEARDPDGAWYRYTGAWKEVERVSSNLIGGDGRRFRANQFVLDKTRVSSAQATYGITFEDISTKEERDHWIAGSSLRIIDLKTNEVIAERIGYMVDPGQGATGGGRSPWILASRYACPAFPPTPSGPAIQLHQTLRFAEKVLHPTKQQ